MAEQNQSLSVESTSSVTYRVKAGEREPTAPIVPVEIVVVFPSGQARAVYHADLGQIDVTYPDLAALLAAHELGDAPPIEEAND